MKYFKIDVDEEVMNYLKKHAEPFEDTPLTVLKRLLFNKRTTKESELLMNDTDKLTFRPSRYIPRSLEEILEVIYYVHRLGHTRIEATSFVASKRNIAYQTVLDKYCRQLGKKAAEIDNLLTDQELTRFKLILDRKFYGYMDVINKFFSDLQTN